MTVIGESAPGSDHAPLANEPLRVKRLVEQAGVRPNGLSNHQADRPGPDHSGSVRSVGAQGTCQHRAISVVGVGEAARRLGDRSVGVLIPQAGVRVLRQVRLPGGACQGLGRYVPPWQAALNKANLLIRRMRPSGSSGARPGMW